MKFIIRSGSLKHFPELMVQLGQSPILLFEECGIELAALNDPDTYISYLRVADLLNKAGMKCQRSDIGAHLALRYGLEMLGALGPLIAMQSNLGQALEMIQKHIGFHARGLVFHTTQSDHEVTVGVQLDFAAQTDCTQLITLAIGALQQVLRQLVGGAAIPARIALRRASPSPADVYYELFADSVSYFQANDHIQFPADLLAHPIQIEPLVRERMEWRWRHLGSENTPLSLSQQVKRAIRASLPTGDCNLDQVAAMVDLHPRVLQNRLNDCGESFRDLLQNVRQELAYEHLQNSDVSLTELALNLGYSEASALSRSFKSWTGLSPQSWKKRSR